MNSRFSHIAHTCYTLTLKKKIITVYFLIIYMYVCLCRWCMYKRVGAYKGHLSVTSVWSMKLQLRATRHECCELNSDPLQELKILETTEPCPQLSPQNFKHWSYCHFALLIWKQIHHYIQGADIIWTVCHDDWLGHHDPEVASVSGFCCFVWLLRRLWQIHLSASLATQEPVLMMRLFLLF